MAGIRIDGAIIGKYSAVVSVVDRDFDAANEAFGVRMELQNRDNKFLAGSYVKIIFSQWDDVNTLLFLMTRFHIV